MNHSNQLFLLPLALVFSACCPLNFDGASCEFQIFEEVINIPLERTYTVSSNGLFNETALITAEELRNAADLDYEGFNEDGHRVSRIELTSAQITYSTFADNVSSAIHLTSVVSGLNYELPMQENLLLPLNDIPEDRVESHPKNLNEFLNGETIKDFVDLLFVFVTSSTNESFSIDIMGGADTG